MILYGFSLSPYVRKVLAYAGEKGIELDLQPTGFPDFSSEFLEASPFRLMPALRDGDFTLSDSSAIIHYLEAKHPRPELIPGHPEQRGRCIWFEEFSDSILVGCGAKVFFNRIIAGLIGRPSDLSVAESADRDELPPILDYLERIVPEPGGFLIGDGISLADIALASPFVNLAHSSCKIDRDRHGRTYAFVDSILDRPSFRHWVEQETAFLSKQAA